MALKVDSHQHFWQRSQPFDYGWLETPEHAPICRDYLPEDLSPQAQEVGVDYTVFVQTQHNLQENRWVLDLVEPHDFVCGVVGWVDLTSEHCEDQLLEFKDKPKFVGVRHITQDEPDDDFIVRDDVVRGLQVLEKHGVPFDLLFFVKHLRHAQTLARRLPDLPMVIDHLAKPRIEAQAMDDWEGNLRAAAAFPNIYRKLSGMITEADWQAWKPSDLKPYVETALDAFGVERCMFGTDWPVCELAGSYQDVHDALVEVLGRISDAERDRIFGRTAMEFYGLKLPDA